MTLGVVHEKNRHAMTPVDPCVVYGSNRHAMTLAMVNENNTHAMTLGVIHEKNRHAMTLVDPYMVCLEEQTCNDSSCGS